MLLLEEFFLTCHCFWLNVSLLSVNIIIMIILLILNNICSVVMYWFSGKHLETIWRFELYILNIHILNIHKKMSGYYAAQQQLMRIFLTQRTHPALFVQLCMDSSGGIWGDKVIYRKCCNAEFIIIIIIIHWKCSSDICSRVICNQEFDTRHYKLHIAHFFVCLFADLLFIFYYCCLHI